MEIRTLRYFLAVARDENMTRAAESLHVTQPTLSKAIKSLEEELEQKLFTRQSFSIKLTDEGFLLRNRAAISTSAWLNPTRSVTWPGRSILLKSSTQTSSTTLPAVTPPRFLRSWTRRSWTLSFWRKCLTPASMNH